MRPRIKTGGFKIASCSSEFLTYSREENLRKKFNREGLSEEEMREFASYNPSKHACFESKVEAPQSEVELTIFGKKMLVPRKIAEGAGFLK